MSRYTQIHVLTFYPPSNLNRDDLGRPKTAKVGNSSRLRISSQCLKRTWRTSDYFMDALAGEMGTRTKRIGSEVIMPLLAGVDKKKAEKWAGMIASEFGKTKEINTPQLVHYSHEELEAIKALANTLAEENREPTKEELAGLRSKEFRAVDIALFGRMLADYSGDNMDAAAQVSHAFTVNKVQLEDDFFTAVDDLNRDDEQGSAHLDENWFGSGVFYLYICINREQLLKNLRGDQALANKAVAALTQAVARVSPGGKQNSFAALSNAGYILAEHGDAPPRSLALAFMSPTNGDDLLKQATNLLDDTRTKLDDAYESHPEKDYVFYPANGEGKISELVKFMEEA